MEESFFSRYEALCRSRGESPNSVAKAIGASSGSVTAWKRGAAPRNETLRAIAEYFCVSTDYLLGKADLLEEADMAFYGEYRALTEEEKSAIRQMVRLMLEKK
ncbi:MAG: helix-turn-helix transcriptional regulator [Oscillospiraceae bacterium]|nr:helix-turn-helix transcriptional regulator [Oscillospiraceae bacterium]